MACSEKSVQRNQNRQVFDENFLMAVATIGAIALGHDYQGGNIRYAVLLDWRAFQRLCSRKSRQNISELMDIARTMQMWSGMAS